MIIEEISLTDETRLAVFHQLAQQVYEKDANWAPQSEAALQSLLMRAGEVFVQPVLCLEGNTPLARAVAIRHPAAVHASGQKLGYIGFFECLSNAPQSGQVVLTYAESLLRAQGAVIVQAPRVDNMLMGLVVDGFHLPQTVLTTHNPPWYADIFQAAGYQICEKMYTYVFDRKSAIQLKFSLPGVRTRTFNRQNLDDEIIIFHNLQQQIFQSHPGWVARTLEEDRQMIEGIMPMLDDDLVIIAEDNQARPAGLLVCLPDVYQSGRGKAVDNARLISIGVTAPYLHKGLGVIMALHLARNLVDKGYQTLEASWIRDSNIPPQNLVRRFMGKKGREFALFEKILI